MNRVLDLPSLHVYFWERASNGKVTVEAKELAEALGVSSGTMYTALRELTSQGRLLFAYKDSARHPVYNVVDPEQFGTTVQPQRPATPRIEPAGASVPKGRRPAWG